MTKSGFVDWLDRLSFLEREFLRDIWHGRDDGASWDEFLDEVYQEVACPEI